ncbi:MAG: hypothetical protein WC444_05885 [Candidatus Paceibacterota bacterium]
MNTAEHIERLEELCISSLSVTPRVSVSYINPDHFIIRIPSELKILRGFYLLDYLNLNGYYIKEIHSSDIDFIELIVLEKTK